MKTRISFLIIMFFLLPGLRAQQVISSAGASVAGTGVQLSWTVGEPVIETYSKTTVILTQGFHQGLLTVTWVDPVENPDLRLSVYPNPTSGFLKLETNYRSFKEMEYRLFEMNGRLLLDRKVENQTEIIDMGSYTSGTYLLKVLNRNQEPVQTFKIVKN